MLLKHSDLNIIKCFIIFIDTVVRIIRKIIYYKLIFIFIYIYMNFIKQEHIKQNGLA